MSQAEHKEFTWEEIRKHNKEGDCWVVLYGRVLDVGEWLSVHPGGLDPILDMAGTDITNQFETIGHTSTALVKAKTYTIGKLKESEIGKDNNKNNNNNNEKLPKWSESAEALKQYKDGGGIIPLWQIVGGILFLLIALYYVLG